MIRRLALAAVLALGLISATATTTSASELPTASLATSASPPICLYLVPVDFGWCISNPVHDLPIRP